MLLPINLFQNANSPLCCMQVSKELLEKKNQYSSLTVHQDITELTYLDKNKKD